MTVKEIILQRLTNQYLVTEQFEKPEEAVTWFGAIQSQDYNGAKWALSLRSRQSSESAIEEAINAGKILRTHVLRPTWHFVSPENIRWMLELTGPRIKKAMRYYHGVLELDEKIFERSNSSISKALKGGEHLTRNELADILAEEGVHNGNLIRLSHLMMNAELDGIICNGNRRGKQFTYALLDEIVPAINVMSRNQSLTKLAKLYFQSHGPATLKDFAWWSGLVMTDAKVALEALQPQLEYIKIENSTYWFFPKKVELKAQSLLLLPNYDEYIVGYTDRSFIFNSTHVKKLDSRANPLFQNTVVYNGTIIGTWKKEYKKQFSLIPSFFEINVDNNLFEEAVVKLKHYLSNNKN